MNKRTIYIRAAILSIAVYFSTPLFAQDFDDIDFVDDAQDVPFDSGIPILVAAGLFYGAKRAYSVNEAKNKQKALI